MSKQIEPLAYSVADSAKLIGVGVTTLKQLLRDGTIAHRKAGTRTLVLKSDLQLFLAGLPIGGDRDVRKRNEKGVFVAAKKKRAN